MDDSTRARGTGGPPEPEFGEHLQRRSAQCTPRELFCSLFAEPEDNVQYLEPALHFARSILSRGEAPVRWGENVELYVAGLTDWAVGSLQPLTAEGYAFSWPARVVREFAPTGLTDAAWLAGLALARVPDSTRCPLVRQLELRLGATGAGESYAERYASLLRSLGIAPDAIARWEFEETSVCADLSYEHALLGLSLGVFPSTFGPEIAGFNLWMTGVGPCPLLERLREELELRSASLRYFDRYDRSQLRELAEQAACQMLRADPGAAPRLGRGFAAAHASYLRWERGMLGGNIPYSPRDFVLEGVRRKARFAVDHHHDVRLGKHNLAELLREGGAAHETLLDHLAQTASLIRPGVPDKSPFITHALSLDGPMFDAFTAEEKNDLREWIASLDRPTVTAPGERVALVGMYAAPADAPSTETLARARYVALSRDELAAHLARIDLHPAARLFARQLCTELFERLRAAVLADEALGASGPPAYSEPALAELASAPDVREDLSPSCERPSLERLAAEWPATRVDALRDRFWLHGFADVRRAGFEEYARLFGCFVDGGPTTVPCSALPLLAASLNTRCFTPEVLGINLAIEALEPRPGGGVARDQLADALDAIRSFVDRVRDGSPPEVAERVWQRIWRASQWQRSVAREAGRR